MIVENTCEILKKVKEFAKENSAYEFAKNVRIVGNENTLSLYCCDGESAIWQECPVDGKPILGEFCINVFSLIKILKTLPPNNDIGMKLTSNSILKLKGPLCKVDLRTVPVDHVLQISPHSNWSAMREGFFDSFRLISSMADNDLSPISYDGQRISYSTGSTVSFKEYPSEITSFKLNPKIATRAFMDSFNQIDVTEKSIHCRNHDCEIILFQTLLEAPRIDPIIKAVKDVYINEVDLSLSELRSVQETVSTLKEVGKLESNAVDILITDDILISYYDSEFKLMCVNPANIRAAIRIPITHLKTITSTKNAREGDTIKLLLSSQENTMFVANKGHGVIFAGGLSR